MLEHWKIGLKYALSIFALCLAALFACGLFHNFTFWHAFAHAGVQSGFAYAIYYGIFAGPVMILLIAFAVMYFKSKKKSYEHQ